MSKLDALDLLKWLHFLALSVGGGAAVVALLLSGFEEEREDLRGLAATVWSKTVTWGFRLALILGLVMLAVKIQRGQHPFDAYYLHVKLLLVAILVLMAEVTPKALAVAKRGSAMLCLLLFLLTSFVVFNQGLFGSKAPTRKLAPIGTAETVFQSR